ncbi:hypothetical protein ACFVAQ_38025 [Streptomyces sp. NPDC057651]|uniref:hypothetical protein n=1 Tax=unclassified Streptomyces TaxID=2593676 RepID=UPI0036C0816D
MDNAASEQSRSSSGMQLAGPRLREIRQDRGLTLAARSTHEWSNPGPVDAEVVWVITPPLPRQELFPARKKRGTAAG